MILVKEGGPPTKIGIELVTEAFDFDEKDLLEELILLFKDADRFVRQEPF